MGNLGDGADERSPQRQKKSGKITNRNSIFY